MGLVLVMIGFCLTAVACCANIQPSVRNAEDEQRGEYMPPTEVDNTLASTVGFVKPREVPGQSADLIPGPSQVAQTLTSADYNMPYCAGFFVGRTRIVSAAHCFQPVVRIDMPGGISELTIVPVNPEGSLVSFVRYGQIDLYRGQVIHQPDTARVIYYDGDDTVVLEILDNVPPSDHFFRFANNAPNVGEHIFNVGHPAGMPFTFSDGVVSRVIRPTSRGPVVILQATNPTIGGCSGGPLFNHQGEIIGMADASVNRVPQLGIFIAADKIHEAVRVSVIRDLLIRLARDRKMDENRQQGQQHQNQQGASGNLGIVGLDGGRNRY